MTQAFLSQLDTSNIPTDDDKKIVPPKIDAPISASEKLVREEIKKLTENAAEIKKLKEQVERQQRQGEKKDSES
jgi:transposase